MNTVSENNEALEVIGKRYNFLQKDQVSAGPTHMNGLWATSHRWPSGSRK